MLTELKVALLRSTSKPFEKRVPVHPEHFDQIDPSIRKFIHVEKDYSVDFGYPDSYFKNLGYAVEGRESLFKSADCTLLVRPTPYDLTLMKPNSTSLGWFHCVQNQEMATAAIRNKLTLVCMEGLFDENGNYLFNENSKITGRQAIIHGLKTANITALNNPKVIVIGHGSAGVAAIHQLQKLGITDITCCSKRNKSDIHNIIPGIKYMQIKHSYHDKNVYTSDGKLIAELLKTADVIVNATTQDIRSPSFFLYRKDLKSLKSNALIIDISCDKKMAFEFGDITFLSAPILKLENADYYAIDHLPTLDFDYASREISSKILSILPNLIQCLNPEQFCPAIIESAIQIKQGKILNPDIIYFNEHFEDQVK